MVIVEVAALLVDMASVAVGLLLGLAWLAIIAAKVVGVIAAKVGLK